MMRFLSRLHETSHEAMYSSEVRFESQTVSGAWFVVRRCSASRRLVLIEKLGPIAAELEALKAGDRTADRMVAETLRIRMDRAYLDWGLVRIGNFLIDGDVADAVTLYEKGPECLVAEIVGCIRKECELGDDERKN